jgi:hypothetical protein
MTIFEIKSTHINKNGLVHTETETADTLKMLVEKSEAQILRFFEILFPDSEKPKIYHCGLEDEINNSLLLSENGTFKIDYKVLRK